MSMVKDNTGAILSDAYRIKQSLTDAAPLLHIWYDGPLKFAKTSVGGVALISGWADDTDGATTVAVWGTAGVITHSAAATDTLGEIADAVNKYQSQGWHCRIEAGLRATTVNVDGDIVDVTATSCTAKDGGLHLKLTTAAVDEHFIEVSGWDATNDNRGVIVEIVRIAATLTAATATGTAPKIYLCKGIAHAEKETLIWTGTDLASTTQQVIDHDDLGFKPLRGQPGEHFVIKWGTEATTVMTVAAAEVVYNMTDSMMRAKLRSARQ